MTVALHGNLRDFGIGEVFQLIGQQRKSGVLVAQGSGGAVRFWFDEGRIVSAAPAVGSHDEAGLGEMLVRCGLLPRERLAELEAERETALCSLSQLLLDREVIDARELAEIEDLLTRDTIFDLLRWTDGSFRFDAQDIRHQHDPATLLGAEQVLMDGLRMVDEWRTFASQLPSESMVFRRVGSFDAYRRAQDSSEALRVAREERVFLRVDGRAAARRVIDLSRLGTFEGTRALASLRKARLIEPLPSAAAAGERSPRNARRTRAAQGRLATILAFAALATMALVTHAWPTATEHPGAEALRRDAFEDARTAFATRGAQHLLETYRFAHGRAPRSLSELAGWGTDLDASLAPPIPDAYYASDGSGHVWLLAPEH